MRKIGIAILTVLMAIFALFGAACGDGGDPNYTLKFMVDGNIWQSGPASNSEAVMMPGDPFKFDYEFDGWYFDEGTWERPFDANSLIGVEITGDITVYAKFRENHTHLWEATSNFDGTHTKVCELNSEHTVTENCSGGTATCTEAARCSTCHNYYGDILEHTFVNEMCDTCDRPQYNFNLVYTLINSSHYEIGASTTYNEDSCNDTTLEIPSTYKNLPVTSIAEKGFYGVNLTSVTIPNTITSIGKEAFRYCDAEIIWEDNAQITHIGEQAFSLYSGKSMTLPSGVTSIGKEAFYMSALTSITLPNNLTSIGEGAFGSCTGLTTIALPNSVTNIQSNAFGGCTAEIVWGDNPQITALDLGAFAGYCGTSLTIPSTVTSIGNSAFNSCPNLTSIAIPNGVTSIGPYAFEFCTYEIIWGDNPQITTIGNEVFASYRGESVTLPHTVTSLSEGAFYSCHAKKITIPNSITSIGKSAFTYCTSQIIWESNQKLTEIGDDVFYQYAGTSLTIPNGVQSIGDTAFYDCGNLKSITMANSVKSIGESAFLLCDALTSVTLSNNLKNIGYYCFSNCTSLETITVPSSVTKFEAGAFNECTALKNITIQSNELTVENRAFEGCTALTSIAIPQLTKISDGMFAGCTALQSVTVSANLECIDYAAFKDCVSLTDITVPSSVNDIGSYAFEGCSSLTSITISNGVTCVGEYVFRNCPALTLYCEMETEPVEFAMYKDWHGNCPIVWNCNENDIASDGYIYTVIDGTRYGIKDGVATVKTQTSITTALKIQKSIAYKGTSYQVTGISANAFAPCKALTAVYYEGTAKEWAEVSVGSGNANFTAATLYYYSKNKPSAEGDYWHYDPNGQIVVWEKE